MGTRRERGAAGQKEAAIHEPVAGDLLGRGFILPQSAHLILPMNLMALVSSASAWRERGRA
jgi:hypothetical protein